MDNVLNSYLCVFKTIMYKLVLLTGERKSLTMWSCFELILIIGSCTRILVVIVVAVIKSYGQYVEDACCIWGNEYDHGNALISYWSVWWLLPLDTGCMAWKFCISWYLGSDVSNPVCWHGFVHHSLFQICMGLIFPLAYTFLSRCIVYPRMLFPAISIWVVLVCFI